MWVCSVFILAVCAILVQGQEESRLVNLTQGTVRGHIDPNGGLYIFYNIPYATAPTGPNRYKPPLPPPTWMSTFDAVNRNIRCPQRNVRTQTQEDCLVANVFVPDTEETNLPVLVYIHDGAYHHSDGLSEEFRELVRTKKLIVASFNYRLGVHGYLCLGTETAPGNAGLKDQIAFLRWLNANIASFGGNPNDVTLAACSAGSGSIDAITISSITTGLFHKVIMESGVTTAAAGVQLTPIENAKYYARVLGFNDVDDMDRLEEFYQTVSFELLTSRVDAITNQMDIASRFSPCVETDIGQERAIVDGPMNVIRQGNYTKVPMLYGYTNMDGGLRLQYFDTWKDRMNEKFSDFLPAELHFESEEIKEEVAERVRKVYFGDEPVSEDTLLAYILYFTDVLFAYPMLRSLTARIDSLGDTIHLFEYSFVHEDRPGFLDTEIRGANHCAQRRAVMDEDVTDRPEAYKQMKQIMRDYWLNFILTGSPSSSDSPLPFWVPTNAQRTPYMSLGQDIELKFESLGERAALWDSIYAEHYRGPEIPAPADETDGGASLLISNVLFVATLLFLYFNL